MQAHINPATDEERSRWAGFCEIESEPALFNVMLKRFGVKGVKVKEVVSLDTDMLSVLPQPIYGLIFLYKWTPEDVNPQEQSCPDDVWFANQTINNACASVALLNIINNIPGLDLGESLNTFKLFTQTFSPALRGDAIANFSFVKEIHNSFARKMEMLNADLFLKNQATRKGQASSKEECDDGGFHFIAFMPVDEKLWKLDGLERQPVCLGSIQDDWLDQLRPDIEARMLRYEEEHIDFAVLALVKDPLLTLIPSLAFNVKVINTLTLRLDEISLDWRQSSLLDIDTPDSESEDVLTAADGKYALEQEAIDNAHLDDSNVVTSLRSTSVVECTSLRRKFVIDQAALRMDIIEELQTIQSEEASAFSRCKDLGSKMQAFARMVKAKEHS